MREAVARHSDSADRLNNGHVLLINSVNPHNGEKQIRETIGENGGARVVADERGTFFRDKLNTHTCIYTCALYAHTRAR